ncbi:hypothetical protein RHGRI_020856 [Rhododendron griersonianum]|uniref:Uncharacterized protein n=1 Tax=Rhododendron griersonianum TaxID=479676 RepID=A0AAV6JKY3_9ERIC|nr:hypothetical protein RHGRI_020856 [Rhododendron griersonianum]
MDLCSVVSVIVAWIITAAVVVVAAVMVQLFIAFQGLQGLLKMLYLLAASASVLLKPRWLFKSCSECILQVYPTGSSLSLQVAAADVSVEVQVVCLTDLLSIIIYNRFICVQSTPWFICVQYGERRTCLKTHQILHRLRALKNQSYGLVMPRSVAAKHSSGGLFNLLSDVFNLGGIHEWRSPMTGTPPAFGGLRSPLISALSSRVTTHILHLLVDGSTIALALSLRTAEGSGEVLFRSGIIEDCAQQPLVVVVARAVGCGWATQNIGLRGSLNSGLRLGCSTLNPSRGQNSSRLDLGADDSTTMLEGLGGKAVDSNEMRRKQRNPVDSAPTHGPQVISTTSRSSPTKTLHKPFDLCQGAFSLDSPPSGLGSTLRSAAPDPVSAANPLGINAKLEPRLDPLLLFYDGLSMFLKELQACF